jgi:hypothetical protein
VDLAYLAEGSQVAEVVELVVEDFASEGTVQGVK